MPPIRSSPSIFPRKPRPRRAGDCKGEWPKNKSERGHQDRSEADARRALPEPHRAADFPCMRSFLANSTLKDGVLGRTSRINITRPIEHKTLSKAPDPKAKKRAKGHESVVPSSTLNGRVQLSYCAAEDQGTTSKGKSKTASGTHLCGRFVLAGRNRGFQSLYPMAFSEVLCLATCSSAFIAWTVL